MIPFEQIMENKEYRERIIKFFRVPIKLSASKEKLISDLEFMKHTAPEKYKMIVEFTEADFNKLVDQQKTNEPDFTMENVLEPLLKEIEEKKEWKQFMEKDYSGILDDYEGIVNTHGFYKEENDGKHFLSIDLEAANWQSLQRIVGFDDSYENTIKKYTTNLIPPVSKTFRTKITGVLGSKNITDYNKKILRDNQENILKNLFKKTGIDLINEIPFAFYADEFIMELNKKDIDLLFSLDLNELENELHKSTGIKLHVRPFTLRWMNIDKGCVKFSKNNFEILNIHKDVLLIINKIMNGYEIKDVDFESIKLKKETKEEFISRIENSLNKLGLLKK